MVNIYNLNDKEKIIKSDLAAEFPIYIYISDDKKSILYSNDIIELLEDCRVKKPLNISVTSLSFMLQNGVIPPPQTIYSNIFICGYGDDITIKTSGQKVKLDFDYTFPFFNKNRSDKKKFKMDENYILDSLAKATIDRIDNTKETYLFHSAGKDSNMIALALSTVGYKDNLTLITHKSKGGKDESEISKQIAKKLGFKHEVLHEVNNLERKHIKEIEKYFTSIPFPNADNVSIAYPLYAASKPDLYNSNLIDGGGNDSYMMTPPSGRDFKMLPASRYLSKLYFMKKNINSENILNSLVKTTPEWFSMWGLSYRDSKKILPESSYLYDYWTREVEKRKDWDIYDFKTDIYTKVVVSEMHIAKARIFCNSINSNLILPFANEKVANYFKKMPEEYLFDRNTNKNKLILRQILKKRLGLDSDKIGKMGYSYDSRTFVINNYEYMKQEILNCKFWVKNEIENLIHRFERNINIDKRIGYVSCNMIYRLYLISSWLNKSKYIN